MIGRWLAQLTPQEEDNLLTTKLVPFTAHYMNEDMGCLVGVALKHLAWGSAMHVSPRYHLWMWWAGKQAVAERNIACRFNEFCQKLVGVPVRERRGARCFTNTPDELLGGARAAELIRARILKHRAARALAGVQAQEAVTV